MGLIHIYCGDGKGKTTAALGLALRAAGRGSRVTVARFLKNNDSGELVSLALVPGIRVLPCQKHFGFSWQMTKEQRAEAKVYYGNMLEQAWAEAVCGGEEGRKGLSLLVLDEIAAACRCGLVEVSELCRLLDGRPDWLEVVLTGREPSEELCRRADYISEIRKLRHPYDRGIAAREGIEY